MEIIGQNTNTSLQRQSQGVDLMLNLIFLSNAYKLFRMLFLGKEKLKYI